MHKIKIRETITDMLIAILASGKNTKRFHIILNELETARYNKESIRVALSRLNKNGYVKNSKEGWELTVKGEKHLNRKNYFLIYPHLSTKRNQTL